MGKQLMISDAVYNTLLELKTKNHLKSFTQLFEYMSANLKSQDMLAAEIAHEFENVKKRILETGLDSSLVDICDKTKLIVVNMAKAPRKERLKYAETLEGELDTLVSFTAKLVPKK